MFFNQDNDRDLEIKRLQDRLPAIKKAPHAQMLNELIEAETPLEDINTMHEFFDGYFQLQLDNQRASIVLAKSPDDLVKQLKNTPELAEFIEHHLLTLNHYLHKQQRTSISKQQINELFPDNTPLIYTLLNTSPLIKNADDSYSFVLYSPEFAAYMEARIDLDLAQHMVNEGPK